jgi:hypothetical protein
MKLFLQQRADSVPDQAMADSTRWPWPDLIPVHVQGLMMRFAPTV